MNEPQFRLACLDMAGTTVSDEGAVLAAFGRALDTVGIEDGTPERENATAYTIETMGRSKIEVFRAITGDERAAQRANSAFEAAYLDSLDAGGAAPVDGAAEAIRNLRENGTKVALTTGFSVETREALLDSLGWHDLTDLVLSPSDAGRGRPYPDMILTAVIRLCVDDVRQVAVAGDTTSDVLSGHRAGAGTVAGVLTGAHRESDFATVPHTHVLASITDLPTLLT